MYRSCTILASASIPNYLYYKFVVHRTYRKYTKINIFILIGTTSVPTAAALSGVPGNCGAIGKDTNRAGHSSAHYAIRHSRLVQNANDTYKRTRESKTTLARCAGSNSTETVT